MRKIEREGRSISELSVFFRNDDSKVVGFERSERVVVVAVVVVEQRRRRKDDDEESDEEWVLRGVAGKKRRERLAQLRKR